MLHIRKLSGEDVASMPVEEVSCIREVKQRLHHRHGLPPRFRQRLVLEGANLDDAANIDSPLELELVVLPLSTPSQTDANELVAAAVESMLQRPLDPNLAHFWSHEPTALMNAAHYGHAEVVRLLLEARADKDKADNDGVTALSMAADEGHVEVVRVLLEAGADTDTANIDGYTALQVATIPGHVEVVRLLMAAGAQKDMANNTGNTALIMAAARGQLEVVRLLVAAGADKDLANRQGHTALCIAAKCAHAEVVRLLGSGPTNSLS